MKRASDKTNDKTASDKTASDKTTSDNKLEKSERIEHNIIFPSLNPDKGHSPEPYTNISKEHTSYKRHHIKR